MTSYLEEDLKNVAEHIFQINSKNGWFDSTRKASEEIALLHSEVSEMFEEMRVGRWRTELEGEDLKPVGVASEAADLFIRLMDFCYRYDINLGKEIETKLEYNKTRPYRHGGKLQ